MIITFTRDAGSRLRFKTQVALAVSTLNTAVALLSTVTLLVTTKVWNRFTECYSNARTAKKKKITCLYTQGYQRSQIGIQSYMYIGSSIESRHRILRRCHEDCFHKWLMNVSKRPTRDSKKKNPYPYNQCWCRSRVGIQGCIRNSVCIVRLRRIVR